MEWLSQYFLNPGLVLPGAALASVPIIIHLLSRLRYKRVRFAAMEFLLQSDEQNRRRLIIEQILLLLLRTLAVVLIMLLLARLVLDPSNMLLLRGATTHHVVIIDDTLSMREQSDNQTVFQKAIAVAERILSEGGSRPGSQHLTILRMTQPERPVLMDRPLDNALLQELIPRLRNLTCSWKTASPNVAITAAEDILSADAGVSPQLHIITDLRSSDWIDRPEVTEALKSLEGIEASVNLVQVVDQSAGNVALTGLTARSLATSVSIPWRIQLKFHNHGDTKSSGLRATVSVDGTELPTNILIPDIEAGEEIELSHDITFESVGQHDVRVRLDDDALNEDNERFLVADVADKRVILLVDDDGQQEDAGYVSAALSADPELTGLAVEQRTSQVLTSTSLNRYDCIYLMNVRDLPADATQLLAQYVRSGGGIVWFPGDQANPDWYNDALRQDDVRLFPVPLGTVQTVDSTSADDAATFQNPVFEQHPVFMVYNIPDSPFAETVQISRWFQVAADWPRDDAERADAVRTLARLKNGDPVIFEHQTGQGRVLTFLTSAGRRWSNWPVSPAAPGYVVMHLLTHQYLQKPVDNVQIREVGGPVRFAWDISRFADSVEVFLPEPEPGKEATFDTFLRLQATPVTADSDAASAEGSESSTADGQDAPREGQMAVTIPQADRPGIYRVRRFPVDGASQDTWLALNVTTSESDLAVADASRIEQQEGLGHVTVVDAATAGPLSDSDSGREMRWFLLGLLIVVLVLEQLLALHMSFHPEVKS